MHPLAEPRGGSMHTRLTLMLAVAAGLGGAAPAVAQAPASAAPQAAAQRTSAAAPVALPAGPAPRGDTLTLAQVYSLARAHNPRVAAAAALADATAARVPGAGL